MSDKSTTRLIAPYLEESEAPLFLSSFFQAPPRNFYRTQYVEVDIRRDQEDIAVPLPDLSSGARENEASKYTNKQVLAPVFDEAGTITAWDQIKRQPGDDPFKDPDYFANALGQSFEIGRKCENKIRRSTELMASQVFQTGVITLVDSAGATMFSCDYGMQSSHKPNASVAWAADGSTGSPLVDLAALAVIIRRDGKKQPNQLFFGAGAFPRFLANNDVQKALDRHTLQLGQLDPRQQTEGATLQGIVNIGNYKFEMWTYDGWYKHPQTGTLTPYIGDDKVIMRASAGRLDMTFGEIPLIVPPDARALRFLPPRITSSSLALALTTNAWITPDNKHVKVSFGTRALPVPTAIDTYGCLDAY